MILPPSFENKSGFDRIRQMIQDNCLCELGRQHTKLMAFGTSFDDIGRELELTDDMRRILLFENTFPQDNYLDSTECLRKMKVEGAYAEVFELNVMHKSIGTIRDLERFFTSAEIKERYPLLSAAFSDLRYFPNVGKRIDGILNAQGSIKDNASPGLKTIREKMQQKHILVAKRIQNILKKAQQEGLVDAEAEITLRDGRQVIPVPANNKRKLGGLVHDESATGKTVFIEPGAIVELNNELRELQYAERREIIKILIVFANDIRPCIDDLLQAYEKLGRLDFLRAKAMLALKINAVKPVLTKNSGFNWKKATHPLLYLSHSSENKEVVPLDIFLNDKQHILIISGPNAGGKSVCLKTVALLQYMLQCGLLVPMSENSEVCTFSNIFIDIGDEQSLENDLSTYSSHLLNMKQFLRNADDKTLILIDEFGTGTEPVIGGAIAEALLEKWVKQGAFGVMTTHYTNLKQFALETRGVVNGAMLFDTRHIRPLFILSIGKPGNSFAIDIARNIGMPEEILKSATEKVGEGYVNFEKQLRDIIRDKKYLEEKRQRIRRVERTLDDLYDNYSNELEDIQKERKKILNEARHEAQEILRETNRQIERTIRQIKENEADKEKTREARQLLEEFKEQVIAGERPDGYDKKIAELENAGLKLAKHSKEIEKAKISERKKSVEKNIKKVITPGDRVRIKGLETVGEVIEVKDKTIFVAFGGMTTTVGASKLEFVSGSKDTRKDIRPKVPAVSDLSERKLKFKPEIDIRGKRADEALEIVRNFVDDAVMVGAKNILILHGKGNGVLRQIIRDYLKTIPFVRKIGDAHADRGGAGITMAEFDF